MRCSICLRLPITSQGCTACDVCLLNIGVALSRKHDTRAAIPPSLRELMDRFKKEDK